MTQSLRDESATPECECCGEEKPAPFVLGEEALNFCADCAVSLLVERCRHLNEAAELAADALRQAKVNAIAHYSNEPYPDDPRWTPWTRWGERLCQRIERAENAIKEARLA